MTVEKTISAKITRPSLSRAVQRKRLFSLLDSKMEKPVVWISSPAGSGKTTLVSNYLESRKLPCIWYRCDEGDSDLATFFYYMGLAAKKAAPRHKNHLLLLTPEYHAGISTFTRRYFEQLYNRLVSPSSSLNLHQSFTIVFDNYQDVPAGSPFHDMIGNGFDMIPEGVRVVVISRSDPPPALARLHANEKIDMLEYGDLRFTYEESEELVHGRIPMLEKKSIKTMYENTEGWAAGIILMLERTRLEGAGAEPAVDVSYDRIFDYFAGEIFNKTEKGIQDFLLKTSFLPVLRVSLAEKLTGEGNAGHILSTLNQLNYFTEKLTGSGQDYQYHPLFRDFLLSRVNASFSPDELAVIRTEAALLIEKSGQTEEAARLYIDAGDKHAIARLVTQHAQEFLRQGRNQTIAEWIAGIPQEMATGNPWLLYWTGMCSFPFDMPRTRNYLEKAFALFKAIDDTSGVYLSWAGIVDTYTFELDEWKHLDNCIAIFDDLRKTYPFFPSQEVDLIVSSRMLISLTLRKTDQPKLVNIWFDHVYALLEDNPSVDIKMDTVFCMSVYYLWTGEYNKNALLLERAEAEIRHRKPSPFAIIRIKMMKGIHYWVTAQYDAALHTLSEGLEISDQNGVQVFDSLLWSFRAAAEMAPGHIELADKSLHNQMTASLDMANTLDIFFYHINSAWHAILTGNTSLAAENMEAISARVVKLGTPYYRALWNIGMAQVAFLQNHKKEARKYVQAAHRISLDMKSHVIEWYSLLIRAYLLLQEGREKEGIQSLRLGLALGKRHGYVHLEFYQPAVMQFLYAKALEEGIEEEYVKDMIKKLGLAPHAPVDLTASMFVLEKWPYPLKIYTLGRFEILRNDEPLVFAGKAQKKPLDLLKAVIAYGGANVSAYLLTDALWPDADGDLAQKSLEVTLGRLRRLLGEDAFIKYSAGQLTLNPLYCRVDSLALENLFDRIGKAPANQASLLCEKAIGLYKGHFLATDTGLQWALSKREMLKNNLLRAIITVGRHYERTGQWERAVEGYLKGMDMDHLAEEFYQRLMVCYQKLGKNADAVKTYHRCSEFLFKHMGIKPSAQTKAIYSLLLDQNGSTLHTA